MIENFSSHKYINLETYRKNGKAVPTPVWFVQDQNRLYVRTIANSGKVKRIRNNPEVRVAVCDARGGLLGDWHQAHAYLLDEDTARKVNQWLRKKYGIQKLFFDLLGKLNKSESATLFIELDKGLEFEEVDE
ncbi:MAG TPA: PPOX class F420-dependent oxidoreductase [Anaerolineales bacterium]|nr:PPOX class F420-dependent oxidoreductase [Anaerolineales bacterium]